LKIDTNERGILYKQEVKIIQKLIFCFFNSEPTLSVYCHLDVSLTAFV